MLNYKNSYHFQLQIWSYSKTTAKLLTSYFSHLKNETLINRFLHVLYFDPENDFVYSWKCYNVIKFNIFLILFQIIKWIMCNFKFLKMNFSIPSISLLITYFIPCSPLKLVFWTKLQIKKIKICEAFMFMSKALFKLP